MITRYDYFIIGFYLLFMVAIGLVFRRMSKNTSDYFRAGGAMPWWITGASTWIYSFSAWTFTGAAGKVYETGTLVLLVYYTSLIGLFTVFVYTCVRFRRMRVVTWVEAVRLRYGPFTEQFYTWIRLPLLLFFAGVGLNAIGVFMSSVFRVDMNTVLIVQGVVVTIVAFTGGAWAVLASDFVQAFMVMTITVCAAVLVLLRPDIGGLGGLIEKVPASHFHWTELARPQIIMIWVAAQVWFKFSDANSMENSVMYLMSRSDRDARRMVLIPIIGTLIGPLIWFIPSMAATVLHPNLAAEFPHLKQPHEAAFVSVAMDVMPQGLLGLLLCVMFGATLTQADAGLNKGVGVFVRSFYKPIINPQVSESKLLVVGKICTVVFGLLILACALFVNAFRTVGLFDFVNQLAADLLIPLALPLVLGLFFRRTPPWSAWSTVAVAGISAAIFGRVIDPTLIQHLMGWEKPLSASETTDLLLGATAFGTAGVGTAWFFLTSIFYRSSSVEHRARVDEFSQRLGTPVESQGDGDVQTSIYRLIGGLCLVYGAFILALTLIPNPPIGRACFAFCGGVVLIVGVVLYRRSKQSEPTPVGFTEIAPREAR